MFEEYHVPVGPLGQAGSLIGQSTTIRFKNTLTLTYTLTTSRPARSVDYGPQSPPVVFIACLGSKQRIDPDPDPDIQCLSFFRFENTLTLTYNVCHFFALKTH